MAEVRTPAESLVPSSAIRSPRHTGTNLLSEKQFIFCLFKYCFSKQICLDQGFGAGLFWDGSGYGNLQPGAGFGLGFFF